MFINTIPKTQIKSDSSLPTACFPLFYSLRYRTESRMSVARQISGNDTRPIDGRSCLHRDQPVTNI